MISFEKSFFINRPPQVVWDFVSDPANDTKWRLGPSEWTSEGPHGVGSTMHTQAKFLGRNIDGTIEITVWDPPQQLGTKAVSGPIPFESIVKFESKENGTELTLSGSAEPGGFFKIAEGLVGKQIEKQVDTDFNALKVLLEDD